MSDVALESLLEASPTPLYLTGKVFALRDSFLIDFRKEVEGEIET